MGTEELVQGSQEWLAARCGSLGASRVADVMARTKSGWGASRANLLTELLVERITGKPQSTFTNAAMEHGTETEPQARAAYEFFSGAEVVQVGLIKHPRIPGTHASPDGLVGTDGLLEIKCPSSATHIETLLGSAPKGRYTLQMQWQMACCGRKWCDFVSFDPRMPEDMRYFCTRVMRDDGTIHELEKGVMAFLAEMDAKIADLNALKLREAA